RARPRPGIVDAKAGRRRQAAGARTRLSPLSLAPSKKTARPRSPSAGSWNGGRAEEFAKSLPVANVRHRGPGFCRRLRLALLQQFDRMQVRRADERHVAIARRAVDGDARFHQAVAGRVDVVDLIGEVAEISVLAVFLLIPIVGELNQRRATG